MSDKHLSNVVLLVGFEGADGSTSFVDESPSGHTLTAVGNAQVDTGQSKFGASSGLFDGNGDYISIPDSDEFTFGAGDFTIETHVRFNVVQTSMFIAKYNNSVTPAEWFFGYHGNLIFLGLLHLAGLQQRHRADRVLRLLLDPGHDPPVARRSVRLPASMERAAGAHGERTTRHAPLDRHGRTHLPDGLELCIGLS
jgi:hypothetical protein